MPAKTMIASARAAYDIHNGPVTVDMAEVRQRKRYIVNNFREGVRQGIERTSSLGLVLARLPLRLRCSAQEIGSL